MYALFSYKNSEDKIKTAKRISEIIPCIELDKINNETWPKLKGVIMLGGDGTILRGLAKLKMKLPPPVFAFNYGSFGCLCPLEEGNIQDILKNDFNYIYRKRLKVTNGEYFLNDAIVTTKEKGRAALFTIYVDSIFIFEFRGDGVIIATPTGSSAYNLSANGPLIHHNCDVILITPLCPLRSNLKPFIIPLESKINIRVDKDPIYILDGDVPTPFKNTLEITYDGSIVRFASLDTPQNYFSKLTHQLFTSGI
ncbi:NAD kinase [Astathelohania contejeani]|uniref:NAD kinase n=1 Tax=Astathelohania contejeani TaxID=164912 RepID=A0ABQ7I279_9MICR|nr:NAD kinase [Thelohania contejeani]